MLSMHKSYHFVRISPLDDNYNLWTVFRDPDTDQCMNTVYRLGLFGLIQAYTTIIHSREQDL